MVNPLLKLARKSRAPSQPEEPETDSLLKKAGRGTLSGLAAVGNLLDVPGGMVRNTLAGRNPLSPVLAPFSSDSRISGRDLLRKAGVVGRKDNWGNWGAGLAVEVATDPLTFLTGGLTKAGTVAKMAGVGGDVAQVASKAAGKDIGRRVAQFGTTIGDAVGTSTAKQSALEVAAKGARTTVAEIGDKPFRESLFGYKVPFTNIEGPIKLGKWEQTAAKYLDDVENVVRYGKYSPVKHLTPLFSKAVKGATTKLGQVTARGISEAGDAAEVVARDRFAPHVEAFEKSGVFDEASLVKGGMSATDARQAIIGRSNRILEYLENVGDKTLPPELEPLRGTLDDMMKTPDDAMEMLRKEGLNPAELKDPLIKYFARQRQSVDVPTFGASDQPAYTTKGGFDIAREDEYRDFVGGTAVLQKMSLDPKISGVAHAFPGGKLPKHVLDELTDYATKTYPEALKAEPMSVEQGMKTSVEKMRRSGMTPEQLADDDMAKQVQSALRSKDNAAGKLFGHLAKPTLEDTQGLDKIVSNMAESEAEMVGDGGMRKLVRAMAYQDPKRAKELTPLYKINPVEAGLARFSHAARTAATARGLRQLMVEVADLVDNIPVPKDAVPLLDVARNAGFTGDNAMELIAQELKSNPRFSGILEGRLGEGAVMPTTETVLKASDVAGLPAKNAKELLTKYGKPGVLMQEAFKPADYENIFRQIAIPREVADDIGRMMKAFASPDEVNALVGALDSFTRLFKSGVTSIFPSFHTRNFGSGLAQNFLVGAADPNQFGPLKYLKPIKDMDSIMSGGVLDDAVKFPIIQQMGITDPAQATQALRRIMFSHGLTGPGQGYLGDAGDLVGSMAEQMPGLRPESLSVMKPGKSLLEIARQAAPTSLQEANPLNIAGVGATKDMFKPVAAGRNVAAYTESLVRGAGFIGFLRQGLDPTEAARRINLAQVDYRNLTPFERTVARRVMPFYAFCVPEDHEILTKDGWKRRGDLVVGELVLALDHSTEEMKWTPLEAINQFEYDGELIETFRKKKHRTYSFQFTPSHNWPIKRRIRKQVTVGGFRQSKEIGHRAMMVHGDDLRDGDLLLCAGRPVKESKSILSPRHAAILGWVVTDGYSRWRTRKVAAEVGTGSFEMIVYQSPKKHLDEIVSLLGTKPRIPHPISGVVCVPVSRADINVIKTVYKKPSDLRKIVCNLSRESAEAMLDAMFKAEGSVTKGTGLRHFAQDPTLNKDVIDAFQVLCLLTGRTCNVSSRGCTVRKGSTYQIVSKRLRRVRYKGTVWCPTTAYGTWVMRHDGQVVITGNSKGAMSNLFQTLWNRPGGRTGQTIRGINSLRSDDGPVPDYVGETAAIPLGKGPTGDSRYLTGLGLHMEDPLSFGGGGVQGMLLEAASRLNPALKAPAELATGQTFFQKGPEGGRPLGDLDPTIGRTISNLIGRDKPVTFPGSRAAEFVLGNSPASRLLTTARQLSEVSPLAKHPKGVGGVATNLLTGARVSHVSEAAQDAIVREQVQRLLKSEGARPFVKVQMPKEELEKLPPEQQERVRELQGLLDVLAKRAKARRKKS